MSSMAARVFNGCRTLLAPATSTSKSSAVAAAAASKKSKITETAKEKAKSKTAASAPPRAFVRPSGIQKVSPVSPALARFIGSSESSRSDAVKKIWTYIKANNLQVSLSTLTYMDACVLSSFLSGC